MNEKGSESHSKESHSELTGEEIDRILDYVLGHKMAFVHEFLRGRGLPFSGTKEKLRQRLEEYLQEGSVEAIDLLRLLNKIEGWGNQHIYLYRAAERLIEPWTTESSVQERLEKVGLAELLHRPRPLVLPDEPTLSSIEWSSDRVRFVWVEKRQWEERISEEDIEEGRTVWRAYRIRVSRGLIAFDWDLLSGHAMLAIQRLPRGSKYRPIRDRFEAELDEIVDLQQFDPIRVSRTIRPIESSGEVRRRQLAYQTHRGGKVRFTSASQSTDAFVDPDLERAGQALRSETAGILGNFYWLSVPGKLERELHSKLYALDQRIGIFGEQKERDVRYVLSRIRHYCGQES